ncbi:MAG: hypothetical protein JSS32_10590 [Verrucomicrobia bacterium]|nr:hypothetical protein [Verrucomicrobiota bacterium]
MSSLNCCQKAKKSIDEFFEATKEKFETFFNEKYVGKVIAPMNCSKTDQILLKHQNTAMKVVIVMGAFLTLGVGPALYFGSIKGYECIRDLVMKCCRRRSTAQEDTGEVKDKGHERKTAFTTDPRYQATPFVGATTSSTSTSTSSSSRRYHVHQSATTSSTDDGSTHTRRRHHGHGSSTTSSTDDGISHTRRHRHGHGSSTASATDDGTTRTRSRRQKDESDATRTPSEFDARGGTTSALSTITEVSYTSSQSSTSSSRAHGDRKEQTGDRSNESKQLYRTPVSRTPSTTAQLTTTTSTFHMQPLARSTSLAPASQSQSSYAGGAPAQRYHNPLSHTSGASSEDDTFIGLPVVHTGTTHHAPGGSGGSSSEYWDPRLMNQYPQSFDGTHVGYSDAQFPHETSFVDPYGAALADATAYDQGLHLTQPQIYYDPSSGQYVQFINPSQQQFWDPNDSQAAAAAAAAASLYYDPSYAAAAAAATSSATPDFLQDPFANSSSASSGNAGTVGSMNSSASSSSSALPATASDDLGISDAAVDALLFGQTDQTLTSGVGGAGNPFGSTGFAPPAAASAATVTSSPSSKRPTLTISVDSSSLPQIVTTNVGSPHAPVDRAGTFSSDNSTQSARAPSSSQTHVASLVSRFQSMSSASSSTASVGVMSSSPVPQHPPVRSLTDVVGTSSLMGTILASIDNRTTAANSSSYVGPMDLAASGNGGSVSATNTSGAGSTSLAAGAASSSPTTKRPASAEPFTTVFGTSSVLGSILDSASKNNTSGAGSTSLAAAASSTDLFRTLSSSSSNTSADLTDPGAPDASTDLFRTTSLFGSNTSGAGLSNLATADAGTSPLRTTSVIGTHTSGGGSSSFVAAAPSTSPLRTLSMFGSNRANSANLSGAVSSTSPLRTLSSFNSTAPGTGSSSAPLRTQSLFAPISGGTTSSFDAARVFTLTPDNTAIVGVSSHNANAASLLVASMGGTNAFLLDDAVDAETRASGLSDATDETNRKRQEEQLAQQTVSKLEAMLAKPADTNDRGGAASNPADVFDHEEPVDSSTVAAIASSSSAALASSNANDGNGASSARTDSTASADSNTLP